MPDEPIYLTVTLNARLRPLDRGDHYERWPATNRRGSARNNEKPRRRVESVAKGEFCGSSDSYSLLEFRYIVYGVG